MKRKHCSFPQYRQGDYGCSWGASMTVVCVLLMILAVAPLLSNANRSEQLSRSNVVQNAFGAAFEPSPAYNDPPSLNKTKVHQLLPLFYQFLDNHCPHTSRSSNDGVITSSGTPLIVGGVDLCKLHLLRRRTAFQRNKHRFSSRFHSLVSTHGNTPQTPNERTACDELSAKRHQEVERVVGEGSLPDEITSGIAREWLAAHMDDLDTATDGPLQEKPIVQEALYLRNPSASHRKDKQSHQTVPQKIMGWLRTQIERIHLSKNRTAKKPYHVTDEIKAPSSSVDASSAVEEQEEHILNHPNYTAVVASGGISVATTMSLLVSYIFDGMETTPVSASANPIGDPLDLWGIFESQQAEGRDGRKGLTIPSLDHTVGSIDSLKGMLNRGPSGNSRIATAALKAAINEAMTSFSGSGTANASFISERAKFIEQYTGPAYYHLWKPQDVKIRNQAELASIIFRRQRHHEAQEKIKAAAIDAATAARSRGFSAQAVDCSAAEDPCKPNGYCQSGICQCTQTTASGFWSGLTCQDCAFGYSGSECKSECQGGFCDPCSGNGICNSGVVGDGSCSCFADSIRGFWDGSLCDKCLDTYFGDSCTETCLGTTAEDGLACNGRGECLPTGNGVCTCSSGWGSAGGCADCDSSHYGSGCTKECPGTIFSSSRVGTPCSGHGTCFSGEAGNGTCVCDQFYSGLDCSNVCPSECSGRGTCDDGASGTATCTCDLNWAPPDCSTCYPNVTGLSCNVACPLGPNGEPCSLNGVCSFSGSAAICTCADGYTDNPDTLVPVCAESCPGTPPCNGHGTCLASRDPSTLIVTYTCQCYNDATRGFYDGPTCDVCKPAYNQSTNCLTLCPTSTGGVCNGKGECREGICLCPRNSDTLTYCGLTCDIVEIKPTVCSADCPVTHYYSSSCLPCPGIVGSDVCNGHGKCYDGIYGTGKCYCDDGYSGEACQFQCPQALNGQVCSGRLRGVCTTDVNATEGVCQCLDGFAGSACEDECEWAYGKSCAGRGTCTAGGICTCSSLDWTGGACETRCLCNTAHGKCSQTLCSSYSSSNFCQECECDSGFSGRCVSCASGYQGDDCSSVCGPHGTTIGKICQCEALWATASCTVPCPVAVVANGTDGNGTTMYASLVCGGQGDCSDGRLNAGTCACYPLSNPTYFGTACDVYCTVDLCKTRGFDNPQCNPQTGACECLNDLTGHWATDPSLAGSCNTCIEGYWGPTCVEECNCNNHGICNANTGTCTCYASLDLGFFTGSTCSSCDSGYIGENCNRINVLITRISTERPLSGGSAPGNSNAHGAATAIAFDDSNQRIYVGSPPLILDATDLSEFPVLARADTNAAMASYFTCVKSGVTHVADTFMIYTDSDQVYYVNQPHSACNRSLEIIIFQKSNLATYVRTEPYPSVSANSTLRIVATDASLRQSRDSGYPATSIVILVAETSITSTRYANANGNTQAGVNSTQASEYTNPLDGDAIIQAVVGTAQLIWWKELSSSAFEPTIPETADDTPYASVSLPVSFTGMDVTIEPGERDKVGEVSGTQMVIVSGSTILANNEFTAELLLYQRVSKVISTVLDSVDEALQTYFPCWPSLTSATTPQCEFPGSATSTGTCTACANCTSVTKARFITSGNLTMTLVSADDTFVAFAQTISEISVGSDFKFLGKISGQCVLMYREDEFNVQVMGGSRYSTVCQSQAPCLSDTYGVQVARLYDTAAIVDSLTVDTYANIGFAAVTNGISRSSRIVKFSLEPSAFGVYGSIQLSYFNAVVNSTATTTMPERIRTMTVSLRQRLLYAPIVGVSTLRLATFLGYEVEKLTPDIADTRGNSTITITGNGYPVPVDSTVHSVYCLFDTVPVPATVINTTNLECPSPTINETSTTLACTGYPLEVSLFGTQKMFTDNSVKIRRVQSATLKGVTPTRGRKSDATLVTITGTGFVESVEARCKFYSSNGTNNEVGISTITIIDPNTITCTQPVMEFASRGRGLLDVSLDGSLYTTRPLEYEVVGDAQGLNMTDPTLKIIAENVSWFTVSAFVVDSEQHRLGDLDQTSSDFLLFTNISEIGDVCNTKDFEWRTVDDGFPYPPCRTNFLNNFTRSDNTGAYIADYSIDPTTWVNKTRAYVDVLTLVNQSEDGIVYFRNLFFIQPRRATLLLSVRGDGIDASTIITIAEGTPIALAISNSLTFKTEPLIIPDSGAPIPDVDVIMVDINGNIIQSLDTITSYAVSVVAYNVDDETHASEVDTRAQLPSPSQNLVYSKIVLSYIHGVNHYLQFDSVPKLRTATSPPMRTKVCSGTTSQTMYKVPRTSTCLVCPSAGAVCNGTETILVSPGYWRAQDSTVNIYVCTAGDSVCLGSKGSANGSYCAVGYDPTLPLCAVCQEGYGQSGQNACAKCTDPVLYLVGVVVIIFILLVVVVVWVIVTLRKAETTDLSVLTRTIVNHMQATGELGEFSVQFDPFVRTLLSIQGTGSSMSINGIQAADCVLREAGGDYETLFWMYMSLPIGCVVIALLAFVVLRIGKLEPVITDKLRREIREDIESVGKHARTAILLEKYPFYMVLVTTLCVTMFTLYQTLITQSTKVLQCTEYIIGQTTDGVPIKQQYLDVDMTIKCTSKGDHSFSTAATVFTVAYGVGIPAAFVFGYNFVNSRIAKPELTKLMFLFLTGGYKESFWYWQAIIMIRKMAIVIVIVFIGSSKLQTYCGMITMAVALILQVLLSPAEKSEHNTVEAISLAVITLTLNLSMVYFWPDLPEWGSTVITVLLSIITLAALLMFAFFCIEPLKQTILEARDAVKDTIEEIQMNFEHLTGNDDATAEEAAEEERRKRLIAQANKGLLTDDHLDDFDEFEDIAERLAPPADDKATYHPPTSSALMSYYSVGGAEDTKGIPKTEGTLKAIIARRAAKKHTNTHRSTGLHIEHETHAEWDSFDGDAGYNEYDMDDAEDMQELDKTGRNPPIRRAPINDTTNFGDKNHNNTKKPSSAEVPASKKINPKESNRRQREMSASSSPELMGAEWADDSGSGPSSPAANSKPKFDFEGGNATDWRSRFL